MKAREATSGQEKSSIVDMSKVEFIASLGMGMLLGCAQSLKRNGHRMFLLNPQPFIEELLNEVGLTKILPICYSEDEAITLNNALTANH
ncbi:MAG: STAS domain-containing protein [Pirellulales bacterium]|nr:STAS domain-containing protein [Pirellulales bacterium]